MNTARIMTASISIIAFIAMTAVFSYAQRDVRRVRNIEFRGLKYISKNEIAGKMAAKADGSGLIVDVDSIRAALNGHPVVKSYQVSEDDGRLVVTVAEKTISFIIAVMKNGNPVMVELDENLRAVSAGSIHASDRPVIMVRNADMARGELSQGVRAFIVWLMGLESKNIPVMREISEIGFADGEMISVILKGRRTKFYLRPNEESIRRLNYFAGYLDALRRYPAVMRILDNYGVMM